MREPLTHCVLRELVRRLCALPTVRRGLFDDAVAEGSGQWIRMDRLLRRVARSDEHAAETVRICEAGLIRPNGAALMAAARQAERAAIPQIAEPVEERRGRSRCTLCGGSGIRDGFGPAPAPRPFVNEGEAAAMRRKWAQLRKKTRPSPAQIRASAAHSKSYTRSRRMLAMRARAARLREAGISGWEASCRCGRCLVCKHREARRRREELRGGGFYWDDEVAPSAFEMELAAVTRAALQSERRVR